tara:strand:- start:8 stop:130 length:123 start_codon:yes stop_codon:yes gene_type:complete
MSHNPMEGIKARKAKATLHKPFSDVPLIPSIVDLSQRLRD